MTTATGPGATKNGHDLIANSRHLAGTPLSSCSP